MVENISKNKNGFSMIELIVSFSLFVIFMSIAITAFLGALRNQRIIVALMSANDSASLTLEQISRELRTAKSFQVSGNEIKFINAEGIDASYRLNATDWSIERGTQAIAPIWVYKKLTADNVKVKNFNITACGTNYDGSSINGRRALDRCGSGNENYPARITISLSITSNQKGIEDKGIFTNIQTTISARKIN
ncbi:MAG: type II secretion system protein [Patescibacteria group bacterium]|mgnify:CR=1 FL=1